MPPQDVDPQHDDVARQHFEWGAAAYQRGDFATAITEFEEAHRLSGRPELLHNLYLAYRDARRTADAARVLRQFLESGVETQNREQLEARLSAMEQELAEQANQPDQPPPDETMATPPPEPPAEPGLPIAPIIVASAGGAMLVGSLVTGLMTMGLAGDLEDDCVNGRCPSRLRDTKDSAETLATVTDVLLVLGVVTAAAGATWFAIEIGDDGEEREIEPSAACTTDGCIATVRGEL